MMCDRAHNTLHDLSPTVSSRGAASPRRPRRPVYEAGDGVLGEGEWGAEADGDDGARREADRAVRVEEVLGRLKLPGAGLESGPAHG